MASGRRTHYHRITGEMRMFDQIVGLVLAILALAYLVYAMLKPEKF